MNIKKFQTKTILFICITASYIIYTTCITMQTSIVSQSDTKLSYEELLNKYYLDNKINWTKYYNKSLKIK